MIVLIVILILVYIYFERSKRVVQDISFELNMRDICKMINTTEPTPVKEPEPIIEEPEEKYFYRTDSYLADDMLTLKMKDIGKRSFESLTGSAMYDKNNMVPYLEAELSNSNAAWWDDDSLDAEF
jgi:hypothetical protein